MALGPFEPGAVSNETLADGQRDESRFGEIAGVNENVGTVILGSQKSEAAICEKSFDSTCIHVAFLIVGWLMVDVVMLHAVALGRRAFETEPPRSCRVLSRTRHICQCVRYAESSHR
jgi:hypothetical protein